MSAQPSSHGEKAARSISRCNLSRDESRRPAEPIFSDDEDRRLFLHTLSQTCEKTGWQVHAFCLMSNHFDLVVETPRPNLVAGMKWFLGVYTARFNRRHHEFGHYTLPIKYDAA